MTTQQIADRWVELVRAGKDVQAIKELYSSEIESIERNMLSGELKVEVKHGFDGKAEKNKMWEEMVSEVHEMRISEPVVGERAFACTIFMDVTHANSEWGRQQTTELCVLEVSDGQILREEYIY